MNNTISGCYQHDVQRAGFTVTPQRDAVKWMSRAAAIYEVCTFRPLGQQPELDDMKKDEGGAPKPVVRGNKAGPSGDVEL